MGAALVCGGELVMRAGNRCEEMGDATAHAEMLVLRGRRRLTGHTLYVTLEPCPMCAGAIALARPTGSSSARTTRAPAAAAAYTG